MDILVRRILMHLPVTAMLLACLCALSTQAQDDAIHRHESTPAESAKPEKRDPAEKRQDAEKKEEGENEPPENEPGNEPGNEPANEPDGELRSLVLPDNGDLRRKLEKVRGQITAGNLTDAARELGRFLQDPAIHDFFLQRDDQRRGGHSFLSEVRRMLRELPLDGQAAYRTQFEPLARSRLNAAIARGDEASLRDVAARFPETKSGDEALFRLGVYLRDHGRAGAALACLKHLRSRPEALAGDERWAAFLARLAPVEAVPTAAGSDAAIFRGGATRNGSVSAQAPFLAPRWSRPAAEDPTTQTAIERAWQWYRDGNSVALPMLSPLAAGDAVFVRTPRGVAAYDFESGQIRWRSPSDDDDGNSGLEDVLWNAPAGGTFAADDECVYLVDDVMTDAPDVGVAGNNVLVAREHFQSREGNLRWQAGGGDGGVEPRLAGAFFLGAPLSWQGNLYVLAEWKGGVSLVVLERQTGRLAWSQELALVEQSIVQDPLRRVSGATPSISADEIIVCPTSGGVIVAVDLTTQSLLWGYRYARETSQPESVGEFETPLRVDRSNRWLDGTLSISGSRVVASPPESQQIHCLDLKSGRPLWTADREGGLFVACIAADRVVVVGREEVRARKLETGEVGWTLDLPADAAFSDFEASRSAAPAEGDQPAKPLRAYPAGRGVFAGDRYFLPMTSAVVLEIDLATGTLAAAHQSPRELPAGNLIWHKGRFVSQGPFALEVFDERGRLSAEVEARLRVDPRDAEALLRRGELELASAGRLRDAIGSFRAAHEAAPAARTKSRLISALLDAVRQKIDGHEHYSSELDSLIGP